MIHSSEKSKKTRELRKIKIVGEWKRIEILFEWKKRVENRLKDRTHIHESDDTRTCAAGDVCKGKKMLFSSGFHGLQALCVNLPA